MFETDMVTGMATLKKDAPAQLHALLATLQQVKIHFSKESAKLAKETEAEPENTSPQAITKKGLRRILSRRRN